MEETKTPGPDHLTEVETHAAADFTDDDADLRRTLDPEWPDD